MPTFSKHLGTLSPSDYKKTSPGIHFLDKAKRAGLPIAPGVIIFGTVFAAFARANPQLHALLEDAWDQVDSLYNLSNLSSSLQASIHKASFPSDLTKHISKEYTTLTRSRPGIVSLVGVDVPTILDITSHEHVVEGLKKLWAYYFSPLMLEKLLEKDLESAIYAVTVTMMKTVPFDASGIVFTLDPLTNSKNKYVVEAVFGHSDELIAGKAIPDHYMVDILTGDIHKAHIQRQVEMFGYEESRKGFILKATPVSKEFQNEPKLDDKEIANVCAVAQKLHSIANEPLDIWWGISRGRLFIQKVSMIPAVTQHQDEVVRIAKVAKDQDIHPLVTGIPVNLGTVAGEVLRVSKPEDVLKAHANHVLVVKKDFDELRYRLPYVAGLISEEGGQTIPLAEYARKSGVPAVIGAEGAWKALADGEIVTINAATAKVYAGNVLDSIPEVAYTRKHIGHISANQMFHATKVFMDVSGLCPELASELTERNVNGIAVIDANDIYMQEKVHPLHAIKAKATNRLELLLEKQLAAYAKAFTGHPVIFRTNDLPSSFWKDLKNAPEFEHTHGLGTLTPQGATRYLHEPDLLKLELKVFKRVQRAQKNLQLMIPFVQSKEDGVAVKKILADVGVYRSATMPLWFSLDTPASIFVLDSLIAVGIDGVAVNVENMHLLAYGAMVNRKHEALQEIISRVSEAAHAHAIQSFAFGLHREDIEPIGMACVRSGMYGVSTKPSLINRLKETVVSAEFTLLHQR